MAINGIWAEIAVLVVALPECYNLPAILTVAIQLANVGPILYITIKYFLQSCSVKVIAIETVAVLTLVAIGLVSCILLSIFWDKTAVVAGELHSVAIILLTYFLALVDCTSSLVFIPFMQHFPSKYISALYTGEGLSGLLPSVFALSQGSVRNDLDCVGNYTGIDSLGINFSPNVYFVCLSSLTLLCGLAFIAIITVPVVRRQIIPATATINAQGRSYDARTCVRERTSSSTTDGDSQASFPKSSEEEIIESANFESNPYEAEGNENTSSPLIDSRRSNVKSSRSSYCSSSCMGSVLKEARNNFQLLMCMLIINFVTNGSLPSISAYVFKPYGNTAYQIAVNLGIVIMPLTTLFYAFFPLKSKAMVAVLTSIACLLAVYELVVALLSPVPPLKDYVLGDVIIVSNLILPVVF